jgi:two-component system, OmpR family, response regulator
VSLRPQTNAETLPRLLVVEDEADIREPLARYFASNQFDVSSAADAGEARKLLAAHAFDLVICDIMMPGEDGLSLCRHVRETTDIPVILLTAKAEEIDRIVGLEVGADDYVVKPFSPRELLARAKVVIRRSQGAVSRVTAPASPRFAFGDFVLKTGERTLVRTSGEAVVLTSGEFHLLLTLVERPHLVLSREQLLDLTQGRIADVFDRSIDNQISRLRRKIEVDPKSPQFVKTVWGGGYTFASEVRRL